MKPSLIQGIKSWTFQTDTIQAAVTCQGGHLAPVKFRLKTGWVEPFDIAPWAKEKLSSGIPPLLRVLRGDFFCMPFGGNEIACNEQRHPPHGETANALWKLEEASRYRLHLSLKLRACKGRVDKILRLIPGHSAIYSRHLISDVEDTMPLGHHPILKIFPPNTGFISTSPFQFGLVYPGTFENPRQGGYSILKPGAEFSSLKHVPCSDGSWADLSIYPAREGYEDLVQIFSQNSDFGWTTVTLPGPRYVWFSLKDPRVLTSTVFWMSNGGRHYPPWNGRHRHAIGVEEVTSYFHEGLASSVQQNFLNRRGIRTTVQLKREKPFAVNFIMGVSAIPREFDRVETIIPAIDRQSITLRSESGKSVSVPIDISFLYS